MTADRRPPTVAQRRFAEVAAQLEPLDLADRFTFVHCTNLWAGPESRSGVGSGLAATARLRAELPLLLQDGDRRPLNLELPPFDFPPPDDAVLEECTEEGGAYADKTLAAWDVRRIRQCWPSPRAAT